MAKISVPKEQQTPSPSAEGVQPNAGMASLAHWSFLIGYVVPFAGLIIPLVLFNTAGKQDAFVKENAKEALNLFICALISLIVCLFLCIILIGFPLLILLGFYLLILPIIAAIQTMGSTMDTPVYRYPCIFRLIQ